MPVSRRVFSLIFFFFAVANVSIDEVLSHFLSIRRRPCTLAGGTFGRSSWPLLVRARVTQRWAGVAIGSPGGAVGRNADFVSVASTLRCCGGFYCMTGWRNGL